jgi:branched-chain amino acid aminotransferase
MDQFIYHNEKILDADKAALRADIAGLLYGWGVFTTLRIHKGEAFAFERYWDRLVKHASASRITPPEREEVEKGIVELIEANSRQEGRARITLVKGTAGGWRIGQGRESEFLIFTSAESRQQQNDLSLTISPIRLLSSSPLTGIKRTAMLEHLFALEEARSRNFDDALLLNERGEVVSASSGNIFWVEGDEIFTPALATGCVAGVIRSFIIDIARRMRIHLIEGSHTLQRVHDANEVFITSTARLITPVSHFDIKDYDSDKSRLTRIMINEFQKLLRNAKLISKQPDAKK